MAKTVTPNREIPLIYVHKTYLYIRFVKIPETVYIKDRFVWFLYFCFETKKAPFKWFIIISGFTFVLYLCCYFYLNNAVYFLQWGTHVVQPSRLNDVGHDDWTVLYTIYSDDEFFFCITVVNYYVRSLIRSLWIVSKKVMLS